MVYRFRNLIIDERIGIIFALLAGAIGYLGAICFYMLLTRKDASAVVPLTALYPALTVVLAFVFLKEALTFYKVIGIVLAVLAVVFLSL